MRSPLWKPAGEVNNCEFVVRVRGQSSRPLSTSPIVLAVCDKAVA